MNVLISLASFEHSEELHQLSMRSKAHWGYDQAFMRLAAPKLQYKTEWFEQNRVYGAVADRQLAGVMVLLPPNVAGTAELESLFVDPPFIGLGVGRALMEMAIAVARKEGAQRIGILSDPQAKGFYERMGARWIADAPSDAIPGRVLPQMELHV